MKVLVILRHGKSASHSPTGEDRDRPLRKRGRRAVESVALRLAESEISPDLILVSPSRRTRETAETAVESAGWTCPTVIEDCLYHATADSGMALCRHQPEEAGTVLVSAHEPMCSELIALLCDLSEEPSFPPAAFAVLDFAAEKWSEIGVGSASLRLLATPRDLSSTAPSSSFAQFPPSGFVPKTDSES